MYIGQSSMIAMAACYGRMRNETGFQYYSNGRKLLSESRNVKNFGNKMTFIRKGRQALSEKRLPLYATCTSVHRYLVRATIISFLSLCMCLEVHTFEIRSVHVLLCVSLSVSTHPFVKITFITHTKLSAVLLWCVGRQHYGRNLG